jgi:hypothetical protein
MRLFLFILIIAITQTSIGQFRSDTVISKRTLDSLQFTIFQERETINRMQWAYEIKVNVKKVDTLKIRQDSVVVNHLNKEGRLVKQEVLSYDKDGCIKYSEESYFSDKGKVAYAERWMFTCKLTAKSDDEKSFSGMRIHYERMKYDEQGRISEHVFWHSTPLTRRILYTYDANGKQHPTIKRITEYEFWN